MGWRLMVVMVQMVGGIENRSTGHKYGRLGGGRLMTQGVQWRLLQVAIVIGVAERAAAEAESTAKEMGNMGHYEETTNFRL